MLNLIDPANKKVGSVPSGDSPLTATTNVTHPLMTKIWSDIYLHFSVT